MIGVSPLRFPKEERCKLSHWLSKTLPLSHLNSKTWRRFFR